MRGLKSEEVNTIISGFNVALLVSAWIEIQNGLGVHIIMSGRTPRECVD